MVRRVQSLSAWWFQKQRASDKHRDPTQGEYFGSSAEPVVRESIQNSLDASLGDGPVVVRIHVNQLGLSVRGDLAQLFDGLSPHLEASAGQSHVVTPLPAKCRYLSIEDFGTRGLCGDPDECFDPDLGKDYYHFFRAEGRSGKTGGRGSWGYGKYTFVKASRVNTFFGLTVPSDGHAPSALGQAVLTNHRTTSGSFEPDGWWGNIVSDADAGKYATAFRTSDAEYRSLVEQFGLSRQGESGLSIVVPFLDEEITAPAVVDAVLANYLPSIVFGDLVVEVTSDVDNAVKLDVSTVEQILDQRDDAGETRAMLTMAKKLQGPPDLALENVATSHSWPAYEFTESDRDFINTALESEQLFSVRVPLVVSPKDEAAVDSYFDVCFMPAGSGGGGRPLFFREGIRVTDANRDSSNRARSMVWIEHAPIARMLGLAETPAHETWTASSSRFKNRYKNGKNWISFVKRAPHQLIDRASVGRAVEDRKTLSSFFPTASSASRRSSATAGSESSQGTSANPVLDLEDRAIPARISPFRSNGFRIRLGEDLEPGDEISVTVAYDVLRGNPFSKWSALDFDLADLMVDTEGLAVVECSGQRMRLRVEAPEAELTVRGFNRWLDVIVRCEAAV